jgi:hypothetical protein
MRTFAHSHIAWLLIALIALSAGHGIFAHHDHAHHGEASAPEDCGFCILAWAVAVIVIAARISLAPRPPHPRPQQATRVTQQRLTFVSGQRAPPCTTC